jgi:hypothetical protein
MMNVPFKGAELATPLGGATTLIVESVVPFVIVAVFEE